MEYNVDDDVVLMRLQAEEISRIIRETSDMEFAYLLQLQEVQLISAMTGEVLSSPALLLLAANGTTTQVLSEDRQLVLREQNEEIERLNQELDDAITAISEQSRFTEIDAIMEHDFGFARALASLPEVEWRKTGESFSDPFVAEEDLKTYSTILRRLTHHFPKLGVEAAMGHPSRTVFVASSVWEPSVLSKAFFFDTETNVGKSVSCWSAGRPSTLRGKAKLCETANWPKQAPLAEEPRSKCVIEEMQSCSICLEFQVVRPDTFSRLSSCGHEFCTNCLRKYAEAQARTGAVFIVCPQPRCGELLTTLECTELLYVDSFRRLTERQIEAAIPEAETSYCPYPGCSALFIRPVLGDTAMSSSHPHSTAVGTVECFNCNRLFCLECQVPWHPELTCEEMQGIPPEEKSREDIGFHSLAKLRRWQRCYKCRCMVELVEGCYHISCRCGAHFCYLCGEEWTSSLHTCANYLNGST